MARDWFTSCDAFSAGVILSTRALTRASMGRAVLNQAAFDGAVWICADAGKANSSPSRTVLAPLRIVNLADDQASRFFQKPSMASRLCCLVSGTKRQTNRAARMLMAP